MARSSMIRRSSVSRLRHALRPRLDSLEGRLLLAAGDLDTTFGQGGIARIDLPTPAEDHSEGVAVQTDGMIITLVTSDGVTSMLRHDVDGSPDVTFGAGGKVILAGVRASTLPDSSHQTISIQADGRIVVAGVKNNPGTDDDFVVARYNHDGSPDTSFGADGQVATDFGGYDVPVSLAIQADGKIVVGGVRIGVSIFGHFAMARYLSDGTLDSTFGVGGKVTTDIALSTYDPGFSTTTGFSVGNVAIQLDGKILVVGTIRKNANAWVDGYVVSLGPADDIVLVRYNADGSPDTAFGSYHGLPSVGRRIDLGGIEGGVGVAVRPGGQIVVTGFVSGPTQWSGNQPKDVVVVQLNPDGSYDTSFGTSGLARTNFTDGVRAIPSAGILQQDGKIVAVGTIALNSEPGLNQFNDHFFAFRFDEGGSPDLGFDGDGLVTTSFSPDLDRAASAALWGDRLVIAGESRSDIALSRYLPDGCLDTTFSGDGKLTTGFIGSANDQSLNITRQADGRIITVGLSSAFPLGSLVVTRTTPDGLLDPTFGNGGVTVLTGVFDDLYLYAADVRLTVQADDKVVIAKAYTVARLDASGNLDTTFDGDGLVALDFYTSDVAIQGGKIVIVGSPDDTGGFVALRLNTDGSRDTNFGILGTTPTVIFDSIPPPPNADWSASWSFPTDITVSDGRIVASGVNQTLYSYYDSDEGYSIYKVDREIVLVRYLSDGSLDTSFGTGGMVRANFGSPVNYVSDVACDVDGSILVAGAIGDHRFSVARFDAGGLIDSAFGIGGRATIDFGADFPVPLQTDHPLARVYVEVLPDGRIAVAGTLVPIVNSSLGLPQLAVARLNHDGSLDSTFGATGKVTTDLSHIEVNRIAVEPNGSILVSGTADFRDFAVVRFQGGGLTVAPDGFSSRLEGIVGGLQQLDSGRSVTLQTSTDAQTSAAISAVNGLADVDPTRPVTITLDLGGATVTTDTPINAPPGVTLVIVNGTLVGGSPALILDAGIVILDGVTALNATDAPTILVTGGRLVIRNSTIEESTGYSQSAILITGGMVDLGTDADPGGNLVNVNGAGALVQNTGGTPVAADGTAFTIDGTPLAPSSLSGLVFEDFNADGEVDLGEQGIAGVTITLDGADFLGNSVHSVFDTDDDGVYYFRDLLPGSYRITETQPAGYTQGINSVGTGGGTVSGDEFAVALAADLGATNYNFGERPAAGGAVGQGQTAGIGFWNNRHGQGADQEPQRRADQHPARRLAGRHLPEHVRSPLRRQRPGRPGQRLHRVVLPVPVRPQGGEARRPGPGHGPGRLCDQRDTQPHRRGGPVQLRHRGERGRDGDLRRRRRRRGVRSGRPHHDDRHGPPAGGRCAGRGRRPLRRQYDPAEEGQQRLRRHQPSRESLRVGSLLVVWAVSLSPPALGSECDVNPIGGKAFQARPALPTREFSKV